MTPEELHRDLTNAFNWPWINLVTYPFTRVPLNRKIMPFQTAKVQRQLIDSVTSFVERLKRIDTRRSEPETGYYFEYSDPLQRGEVLRVIKYYDKDTMMITLCNMRPEGKTVKSGDIFSAFGWYFFFNEFAASRVGQADLHTLVGVRGDYYSPNLPNQYNFFNWVNINPLSGRKGD